MTLPNQGNLEMIENITTATITLVSIFDPEIAKREKQITESPAGVFNELELRLPAQLANTCSEKIQHTHVHWDTQWEQKKREREWVSVWGETEREINKQDMDVLINSTFLERDDTFSLSLAHTYTLIWWTEGWKAETDLFGIRPLALLCPRGPLLALCTASGYSYKTTGGTQIHKESWIQSST